MTVAYVSAVASLECMSSLIQGFIDLVCDTTIITAVRMILIQAASVKRADVVQRGGMYGLLSKLRNLRAGS